MIAFLRYRTSLNYLRFLLEFMDPDLKAIRFEYIRRNKTLIEIFYYCYELFTLTYEEIVENLEQKGENTSGLLIRLERGINLGLITHNGSSSLKDGEYWLKEKGREIFESREFPVYEGTRSLVREVIQKVKEKRRKKTEEKTRYIV